MHSSCPTKMFCLKLSLLWGVHFVLNTRNYYTCTEPPSTLGAEAPQIKRLSECVNLFQNFSPEQPAPRDPEQLKFRKLRLVSLQCADGREKVTISVFLSAMPVTEARNCKTQRIKGGGADINRIAMLGFAGELPDYCDGLLCLATQRLGWKREVRKVGFENGSNA